MLCIQIAFIYISKGGREHPYLKYLVLPPYLLYVPLSDSMGGIQEIRKNSKRFSVGWWELG